LIEANLARTRSTAADISSSRRWRKSSVENGYTRRAEKRSNFPQRRLLRRTHSREHCKWPGHCQLEWGSPLELELHIRCWLCRTEIDAYNVALWMRVSEINSPYSFGRLELNLLGKIGQTALTYLCLYRHREHGLPLGSCWGEPDQALRQGTTGTDGAEGRACRSPFLSVSGV